MTKEAVEARLKQLEEEKLKLILAYDGAIQDCKYWLEQLNPVKEEEKNDQNSTE